MCGEKCLKLENTSFFCQGSCGQKIKKGGVYFVSRDALNVWCQKCHQSLPATLGSYLDPDTKQPVTLLKRDLLKRRHDEQTSEPWVECDRCGYWLHQICALYTDSSEHHDDFFLCPLCILEEAASQSSRGAHVIPVSESEISRDTDSLSSQSDRDLSSVETTALSPFVQSIPFEESAPPLAARCLPTTQLSQFLEAMVKELLSAYGFDGAADTVSIRVTSNVERRIEVNVPLQEFSRQLYGASLPSEIPYRQKCIQLYQEIDGISVVLFSLYVHEFDQSCPAPNTSTVYIAYLDSTDYFRPAQMRSFVYQEIVVGYLLWARTRGFKQCHIWACPPQRGDNFIFWCHPAHQRTPSRDRLNAWYHSILARARKLGVHQGVGHLWNSFFAHLPCRSSETSTREASKRSHSVLAAATALPRKYSKSNKGSRCAPPSEPSVDAADAKVDARVFPPVFEGDYWVLEVTRFYNNAIQRWKNSGQQSLAHAKLCRNVLRTLLSSPLSQAFREPVDPVALKIPSYWEVVRTPMDLGTVRRRLDEDAYDTVLDFAQDVRLTFHNAKLFNPAGHPVHQHADTLLKDIDRRMADVANEARKLVNLTCLDTCALSDDELLQRCKLAPMAHLAAAQAKTGPLKLEPAPSDAEAAATGGQSQPLTPGSRRSKRLRDAHDGDTAKDERGAADSAEEPLPPAQQSPTSVFEGRREELFLCDATFKLTRAVSDDIGSAMDIDDRPSVSASKRQPSRVSPPSPHLSARNPPVESDETGLAVRPVDADGGEEVVPTINASAVAALSATENAPSINVSSFAADLSKSIQRLNDDLFVLRFSQEPLPIADAAEGESRLVPPGVGGRSKKVANVFVPRRSLQLLQGVSRDTSDPDPLTDNPLVDSRHTFLEMSQFRHMQFDTLRRAKHSSLSLVHHQLHRCDKRCGPVCSHCGERIRNLRWHCEQCAGYEVCQVCMLAKEAGRLDAEASAVAVVVKEEDAEAPKPVPAALPSKRTKKNVAPVPSSLPRRETRRRECQLTQRREDDTFVYTPIGSAHRQQPVAQLDAPAETRSAQRAVTQPACLVRAASSSLSLACTSTDSAALTMDLPANDFGVFPGHPHPLTPYRVTYQ